LNVQGIDTSHYNGDVTVHTLDGSDFAFGQATVGLWLDPAFPGDLATFKKAGVVTGAYHYGVYGPGPTRQAQIFLDSCGNAQLLAVDAEARGSNRLLNHPETIRALIINIRNLDPLHRRIGLYASRATLVHTPQGDVSIWRAVTEQDFNWCADYVGDPNRPGVSPRVPWTFWQKSGNTIDRDVFNGSRIKLNALAATRG
jgi:GH25 family lysozyme M1 (1,4-beta-N-acetylmuramidase)